MILKRIAFRLFALAVLVAVTCAEAQGVRSAVTIRKVEIKASSTGGVSKGVNSIQGRHLPKFFDNVQGIEETVRVDWVAPAGGLGAPAKITLDYGLTGCATSERLVLTAPAGAAGDQSTVFKIPRVSADTTRRIETWRVRVVANGQVLAEKQSVAGNK